VSLFQIYEETRLAYKALSTLSQKSESHFSATVWTGLNTFGRKRSISNADPIAQHAVGLCLSVYQSVTLCIVAIHDIL